MVEIQLIAFNQAPKISNSSTLKLNFIKFISLKLALSFSPKEGGKGKEKLKL